MERGRCERGLTAFLAAPSFGVKGETMEKRWFKYKMPLTAVKPVCIVAVLCGIFFFAAGRWAAALCMLLGAYLLERGMYRCPSCGKKLDMKYPLFRGCRCPFCGKELRERKNG